MSRLDYALFRATLAVMFVPEYIRRLGLFFAGRIVS